VCGGYWTRHCGVVSFTDVICGACPAVEELAARGTLIASLREENEALRVKVAALAEIAFGGSERRGGKGRDADEELGDRDDDSSGADGDLGAPGPVTNDSADAEGGGDGDGDGLGDGDGDGAMGRKGRRGQRRGAAGHGRRRYDHLEVRVVVHDLGEAERCCGCCGAAYEQIAGDEISSEISWRVVVYRIEHRRRRYRRGCDCGGSPPLKVAPVPAKVIPKGLFSALAIASVLVEKFALARPVNKIIASLSMHGLEVSPGSLAGVLAKVNVLLAPLGAGIVERTRTAGWWHCDETSWACFSDPDTRPDGRKRRWWLWVARSIDATSFVAAPSRAAKVLDALLGADDVSTRGIVCSDMYGAYGCLDQLRFAHAWCWAHVRRHIIRAAASAKVLGPWADAWLADIKSMYAAWHARRAGADDGAALAAALAAMRARLDSQVAAPELLVPQARKVIEMIERHWDGLVTFAAHPEIPPDNNAADRALRPEVLLRKTCGGSGAPWAAELAARAFSVIATAGQANLNPLSYLHAYLSACAEAGGKPPLDIARFLPWSASPEDLAAWRAPPP